MNKQERLTNVVLIGFMGCGKSSVGVRLSYRLKKPYLDTDKLIEKEADRSVSDIFVQSGEQTFRDMETACLEKLIQEETDAVISTGGGLPMREENHRLLRELGQVIYLKISPEGVYDRLKNDTTRPLLQVEDPLSRIRELMETRHPVYADLADHTIEVDRKSFEEILQEIQDIS